jgi:hypothetical protein
VTENVIGLLMYLQVESKLLFPSLNTIYQLQIQTHEASCKLIKPNINGSFSLPSPTVTRPLFDGWCLVSESWLYHMNVRLILIARSSFDVYDPLMGVALIDEIYKPRTDIDFESNLISTTENLLKYKNYNHSGGN